MAKIPLWHHLELIIMKRLTIASLVLLCFLFTVQCSSDDNSLDPPQTDNELRYFGDAGRINLPSYYRTSDAINGNFEGDLSVINPLVYQINYLKTTFGETSDFFIYKDWWESCNDLELSEIDYITRECYALSYRQLASVEFVELIETEVNYIFNYGLYNTNEGYEPSFYYRLEASQNLNVTEGQHNDGFSNFNWSTENDSLNIDQTRPNLPTRLITISLQNYGGHYKICLLYTSPSPRDS